MRGKKKLWTWIIVGGLALWMLQRSRAALPAPVGSSGGGAIPAGNAPQ